MSKKSPAFLFYPSDFEQGTQLMSPKELGVYMRLLIGQFNYGELPKNSKKLAKIARISDYQMEVIWSNISEKFLETETGYYNERLRLEIEKRTRFVDSRRANAGKRYLKDKTPPEKAALATASGDASAPAHAEDMPELMENEKENRYIVFKRNVLSINSEHNILIDSEVFGTQGRSFIEYWTESGDKDRKMRFEKEKSFSVKLRLLKWKANDYNKPGKNEDDNSPIKVG